MTTPSALVRKNLCTPSETLPGTLADAITDAVGHPEDPPSRSSMICTLLGEVYDSVAWVHGSDAGPDALSRARSVRSAEFARLGSHPGL